MQKNKTKQEKEKEEEEEEENKNKEDMETIDTEMSACLLFWWSVIFDLRHA